MGALAGDRAPGRSDRCLQGLRGSPSPRRGACSQVGHLGFSTRGRRGCPGVAWACLKTVPSSPPGSGCLPGPASWNPASRAAQPLSPRGSGRPGVGGAPGEAGGAARRSFVRRNGLFAVPGVGEDEPVIIFKFAIIDLGKSYCDKNELIIKFISEINSGAIKHLAGDGGAAGGSGLRSRQVPAPKPGSLRRRTGGQGPSDTFTR